MNVMRMRRKNAIWKRARVSKGSIKVRTTGVGLEPPSASVDHRIMKAAPTFCAKNYIKRYYSLNGRSVTRKAHVLQRVCSGSTADVRAGPCTRKKLTKIESSTDFDTPKQWSSWAFWLLSDFFTSACFDTLGRRVWPHAGISEPHANATICKKRFLSLL